MVNAHSHAFQRDLRGMAERPSGPEDDFWSWREAMYALAERHDPASMRDVAERAYREMAAAGYGAVGEFHYVHHQPDGTPYDDPNALAVAIAEAADAAGITVVLLPTAYHRAGAGRPAEPRQRRFCDPDVETYLGRVDALRARGLRVGVAAHSVRAVPASWLEAIAAYADEHGLVRHIHAHEQPREIDECRAEHDLSPIELLDRTGFLGPRTSVVHGIHVTDAEVGRLAATGHDRRLVPDHRGQPRRRALPGARLSGRRRPDRDRQRLERPHRSVRGGARAGDGRAPLGPDAARPRRPLRRPVERAGGQRPRQPRPRRTRDEIEIDIDHPQLAGIAADGPAAGDRDLRVGRRCQTLIVPRTARGSK